MIFRGRFPVFLPECRPPGFRNRVPAIIHLDTEVEISELSKKDVPTALRARSLHFDDGRMSTFEYRYIDGRFFRRAHFGVAGIESFALVNFWERPPGFQKLVADLYKEALPFKKKLHPGNMLVTVEHGGGIWPHHRSFLERSRKTVIEDAYLTQVNEARNRYEEACSAYVLLDGEVWHSCREPLLSVDTLPSSSRRGEIGVFDGELPEASPIYYRKFLDRRVLLFPFGDLEKAREVSDGVPRPEYPPPGSGFVINHIRREFFQNEFPAVQDAVRVIHDMDRHGYYGQNEIAPRIRAFLDNDAMWDCETIEALLEEISSPDSIKGWPIRGPGDESLKHVLERIGSRPISVDAGRIPSFR